MGLIDSEVYGYKSIEQVLEFYEQTVFYPYGFKEALLDIEKKLLDRIKELENDSQNPA